MSLHILLAHTGSSLTAEPRSFASLDELRSWIYRKTSVEAAHQILMTARGKQVKLQTLFAEQEIFLYDRRILASSSTSKPGSLLPTGATPGTFTPDRVPDDSANDSTLPALQSLFKRRRAWAIKLADGARKVAENVQRLDRENRIVRRGAAIAVENIKQHVGNLHPKYQESKKWADQMREDQTFLLRHWEASLDILSSIGADEDLGKCLHGVKNALAKNRGSTSQSKVTLRDLVDDDEVKRAAKTGEEVARQFGERVDELSVTFEGIVTDSSNIIEDFEHAMTLSDSDVSNQAGRLMEEIEVVARKINADYEYVLGLPSTPKSTYSASKTAQVHKSNFIPSLIQTNDEINLLLVQTIERRERNMRVSVLYLQEISVVESAVSSMHSRLATLDVEPGDGQIFDLLSFVVRLPSVYGCLLVECIKRQEWSDKMTADSSSLVEEMATYKDEESRRRKKWIKEMDGVVDLGSLDDMALDIEVNVQAQKQRWPRSSRNDLTGYVETLRQIGDLDSILKELEEHVKTLDSPTKQQARRAKAFKNGSVHEAAYGRTSLLLRGDDEVLLALRSDKSKVEDKLKSAESRVRKLEDLLHRQSQLGQLSRPSSATGFPPTDITTFQRHATAPVTNFSSALSKARETGSRRSSDSSRRISMNNDLEERGLAQRVASLEAELTAEKAQSAQLKKDAAARTNAEDLLKSQVREAVSTKEDLLGNFEAQQREFDEYRRQLEEENSNLKLQLENLEDEFDRVVESRENVDKARALEEELERLKNDTASEVQKAQGQTESLRNDYNKQREKANTMERENQQQSEENARLNAEIEDLSLQLRKYDQAQEDQHRVLRSALLHLSQKDIAPNDFGLLVDKIEAIAGKSATHLRDIESALEMLRADNAALESRIKSQDDEIYNLRERLGSKEKQVISLTDELTTRQTEDARLQSQIDRERSDHDELKVKFASGITDSEALRSRLMEGEHTIANLSTKLDHHETESMALETRIKEKEAAIEALKDSHSFLEAARDAQASRAVDLSNRLYIQNATLERLLEQVGFTVTKQDDAMVVQKAQKATSASTTLNDASTSMKRSLSGPMPSKSDHLPTIDPELLHWADAEDLDTIERRFSQFLKEVNSFDLDVFSEAIYKRVKEIEHIARKWQKEARAYRDKAHRAQGEAQDRIALRNFKEGDLALFLPTRDQATKPWAAFNVGAPHCFLREQDSHNLSKRDWLIARISKVEERVVDLSKSLNGLKGTGDQKSIGDKSDTGTFANDENPYELSDGLRWYLIDAAEEKPGAPINVGLGKATVLSSNVDAQGSIRMKKSSGGKEATKTLTRSLDSRRSSTNSKKNLVATTSNLALAGGPSSIDNMLEQSIDNAAAAAASSKIQSTRELPDNIINNPDIRTHNSSSATNTTQQQQQQQQQQQHDPPATSSSAHHQNHQSTTTEHIPTTGVPATTSPTKSSKSSSSPRKTTSPEKQQQQPKAWDALLSWNLNLEGGRGRK